MAEVNLCYIFSWTFWCNALPGPTIFSFWKKNFSDREMARKMDFYNNTVIVFFSISFLKYSDYIIFSVISRFLHELNHLLSFFSFTTRLFSHWGKLFVNLWANLRLGTKPQQKEWRKKLLLEIHDRDKESVACNELHPIQRLRSYATSIPLGWEAESFSSK